MTDIKFIDALNPEQEAVMEQDLVAYEASHGIDVNYKRFHLILEDDSGVLIGVLTAYTAFAEVYIDDMWVHSDHRGKGYGRLLIDDLETRFKSKGFNNINLCTNQFNAPDFYKKCGFELEFVRKNLKNPKLNKYFMVKFFDDEDQTQGIIDRELQ